MKVFTLHRTQRIRRPRSDVFAFFEQPENLARITPPSMGFEILTPPPIIMKEGAVIDYRVRIFGLSRHWRTLITAHDPPHRFVDEQLAGPYRFWHHTHTFEDDGDATVITDDVRYVLPFGPLGRLAHALVVRRQLDKIFAYRERVISTLIA